MVTFFSLPKPFQGHIGAIQRNAIRSWRALGKEIEIVLLGNEFGVETMAQEVNAIYTNQACPTTPNGAPRLDWIFRQGNALATHPILCYLNSDILFTKDFLFTIEKLPLSRFLTVGYRTNISVNEEIDFSRPSWEERAFLSSRSFSQKDPRAIDYFIFSKGQFDTIPPFALGRCFWDNWLLFKAKESNIPIIDASQRITAFHQNHHYEHVPGGKRAIWTSRDRDRNLELAGGGSHLFSLLDADFFFTKEGNLLKKNGLKNKYRAFFTQILLSKRRGTIPRNIYNLWFQFKVSLGKIIAPWRYGRKQAIA